MSDIAIIGTEGETIQVYPNRGGNITIEIEGENGYVLAAMTISGAIAFSKELRKSIAAQKNQDNA